MEKTGEYIQGVNVIVKNTKIGSISNNSGTYKISVSDNNAVVVFSAVNYFTQEVQVSCKEIIDILLQIKFNSAFDNKVLLMLKEYGLD